MRRSKFPEEKIIGILREVHTMRSRAAGPYPSRSVG